MKENIKLIKEKEEFILGFIKYVIENNFQKVCQFWTSLSLFEAVRGDEIKEIVKLNKMVIGKINDVAPLHRQSMYSAPLLTVTNDTSSVVYNQNTHAEYTPCLRDEEIHSVQIQYSQFEDKDISWDFCKRILSDLAKQDIISRKNSFGGNKFILNKIYRNKLKKNIKASNKFIEINAGEFIENNSLNWIFQKFSKKEINKIFELNKKKLP